MESSGPGTRPQNALARALASPAMADVVTYFVLYPEAAPHFRALQRATGVSSRSLQHETARLLELEMMRRVRDGRRVRYSAVADHPRWSVFREMVREFAGPEALLRIALSHVPGVEGAFIYGSFARGDVHPESDIDVFALGAALDESEARYALAAGTLEAAGLLGREVNVTTYTPVRLASLRTRGSQFLRSVLAGEKRWLLGDERLLRLEAAEDV
jgi:predicted nucleotidyltransferase